MTSQDPAAQLVKLFFRVARRIHQEAVDQLAPLGLTPSQGRALLEITHATDPLRLADLASRLGIAPRSATEVVDALEFNGLVIRQPNPADRRTLLLAATDRGEQLCTRFTTLTSAAGRRLFDRLSDTERDQLLSLMGRLDDPCENRRADQREARMRVNTVE